MKTNSTMRMALAVGLCGLFLQASVQATESTVDVKALFYDPTSARATLGAHSGGVQLSANESVNVEAVASRRQPEAANVGYAVLDNPGVMYWIELVSAGNNQAQRVSNSKVFRSGEKIRIHVTPNGNGLINAVHRGSSGKKLILPVAPGGKQEVYVSSGQEMVIPPDGTWLRFDNRSGMERIQLVFTPATQGIGSGQLMSALSDTKGLDNLADQVAAVADKYSASENLKTYEQSGTKDLVLEGASAVSYSVPVNRHRATNFKVSNAVLNAPANYAVNVSGEPVAVNISLKHR